MYPSAGTEVEVTEAREGWMAAPIILSTHGEEDACPSSPELTEEQEQQQVEEEEVEEERKEWEAATAAGEEDKKPTTLSAKDEKPALTISASPLAVRDPNVHLPARPAFKPAVMTRKRSAPAATDDQAKRRAIDSEATEEAAVVVRVAVV